MSSFFNLGWAELFHLNLSPHMDWKVLFSVTIWNIWRARNMTNFELKMKKVFSLFNSLYLDYTATNQIMQGKGNGKVT